MSIVAKFGGSVLAEGSYWQKILDTLNQDDSRKIVVVSAIGKKFEGDTKVTDLLFSYCKANHRDKKEIWEEIQKKYLSIALHFNVDISALLKNTYEEIQGQSKNFIISRGEYLSAKLFSLVSGYEYFEAAKAVRFDKNGLLFELSEQLLSDLADGNKKYVIGGFYGSDTDGNVVLFDRGGSDITGALVASAVNAEIYENWTDVSGLFVCDPRVVLNPTKIKCIGYEQLKTLSAFGAKVLHPDSIYPIFHKKIPINIKSVFKPFENGTFVTAESQITTQIYGITCKKVSKLSAKLLNGGRIPPLNALHCSFNAGFCEVYYDENTAEKPFVDGVTTISKTSLLCVAGGGDIGIQLCKILTKSKIVNKPIYFDDDVKLLEVGYNDGEKAVNAVYNAYF